MVKTGYDFDKNFFFIKIIGFGFDALFFPDFYGLEKRLEIIKERARPRNTENGKKDSTLKEALPDLKIRKMSFGCSKSRDKVSLFGKLLENRHLLAKSQSTKACLFSERVIFWTGTGPYRP